jgi:hypothetical protein
MWWVPSELFYLSMVHQPLPSSNTDANAAVAQSIAADASRNNLNDQLDRLLQRAGWPQLNRIKGSIGFTRELGTKRLP